MEPGPGWEIFGNLVQYFGMPGAMLAVFVWAIHKGVVIPGREAAEIRRIAEVHERAWQTRYDELLEEKNMWRSAFLDGVKVAERAVNAAEITAKRLPNQQKQEGASP